MLLHDRDRLIRILTNRDRPVQLVVREYTEHYYRPAAAAYPTRAADHGRRGAELIAWRHALAAHWPEARFGAMRAERDGAERPLADYTPGCRSPWGRRGSLHRGAAVGGSPAAAADRSEGVKNG
ncbi:MAG: hypothetical protein ACREJV_15640 [Candidatus Rokuibacteriota bacterium]